MNLDKVKFILKVEDLNLYSADYQAFKRLQNCLRVRLLEIEKQKQKKLERRERILVLQDLQKELKKIQAKYKVKHEKDHSRIRGKMNSNT